MQAKLTMLAWQALYNEMHQRRSNSSKLTDDEREFVTGMNLESQKYYDNIDEFITDIIADKTAIPLMQAAMGDVMEKWKDR